MKSLLIASAIFALALAETYKPTHDDLDVEAVVSDPETLKAVTLCFLDKGPCKDFAETFRKVLPEIMEQACAKCTEPQKHMLKRYLDELEKNVPEDFAAVAQKYDPENKYQVALRAALADA